MGDLEIHDADIDAFLEEYNSREVDTLKHLSFDEPRRAMLKSWDDVQACPGSGKTTLVAAKLLILVNKWSVSHQGICVLTHTNVACDEIRERLQKHPAGYKLTSYPHFIGTIQEFINKYLALPYLRSKGFSPVRVDDDACVNAMSNFINIGTKNYLENKRSSLIDLKISHSDGELNIPAFKKVSASPTYKNLKNAFVNRANNGLFFYSEMYYFAKTCLSNSPDLVDSIRKRFPIVFIDEMQDTQKFQDDIINSIFETQDVKLQKLGDPDQAIFDNMGGEAPNESFNSNSDMTSINSTHRFGHDISSKILGLSITKIGEIGTYYNGNSNNTLHTIFTYSDETKSGVLERFSEVVEEHDFNKKWTCIKAVGATEGAGGFISKYWADYDRKKSVKKPKPEKLIHIVKRKWWTVQPHSSTHYSLLVQGVIDLLRLSGKKDTRIENHQYFSAHSLSSWLKDNDKQEAFRKLLTKWVYLSEINSEIWIAQVAELQELLCITSVDDETTNYLAYDDEINIENEENYISNNIYKASNGREIEVATIHSVKGETHNATLVLETKFNQFDVKELLDHIALINRNTISAPRKSKFMRQLYVAASRPRNLLCFAVHEDHISSTQEAALVSLGWRVATS